MSFRSVVQERAGGWRRRGTPLVISGVLHVALLLGLASHRASPVKLSAARPAGDDAGIALTVPVRITGMMYGPVTPPPEPTPPFKAITEMEPRPREAVAAGRTPGRRSRPRGLTGLMGKVAAPVDGSAATSAPVAAAVAEPQPPEPRRPSTSARRRPRRRR